MKAARLASIGRRRILRLAAGCAAGSALGSVLGNSALGSLPARAANDELPIGMNMAGIADWEHGFPFLNLMWGARIWLTRNLTGDGPWNTELTGQMEMDENGYPLEVPFRAKAGESKAQYVFTILPNVLTPGTYVILYDGAGEFGANEGTRLVSAKPGRVVISMKHGEPLEVISIRRSERGNHVRNVRVLPLEHEKADLASNPFRPDVLEFCKPWHCLRFMDWLSTNNSVNRTWADRKRRTFYTQCGTSGDALGMTGAATPAWQRKWSSGIAIELCLQLANQTRSAAWLCVPHLVDDDYITEMAKLVKAQLDPSLKVYVEFSNEIWNWQFLQAGWMLRSELAAGLVEAAGAPPPWKGGARPRQFANGIVAPGAGEGSNHPERTGALFRRCFKLWEDVFTGADRDRLVRVCAVQADWGDTVHRTLSWVMQNGGCDALAPAGYFGPNEAVYAKWDAAGARLTTDDVVSDMRPMIAEAGKWLMLNAEMARQAGVRLVVYEGGQHIQPSGQAEKPYGPALRAVQKHPAMLQLYRENLKLYAKEGCDLFCAFNSVGRQGTRWGSWGHAERYGQNPAEMPKYKALLEANSARNPQ